AAVRDGLLALGRIEARYLVLRDPSYEALWEDRAARTLDDLERLRGYGMSQHSAAVLAEVLADFQAYRRVVAREQALLRAGGRGRVQRAPRPPGPGRGRGPRRGLQRHDGASAARRRDERGVLRDDLARATLAAHLRSRGRQPPRRRRAWRAESQAAASRQHRGLELRS